MLVPMSRLFFLAVLSLLATAARAQGGGESAHILEKFARYRHFTIKDGLSSNSAMSFAQDEDGFIWIGTEEGLNRFDGKHFTNFYYRTDGTGLPSNAVSSLVALPGKRLLVGTGKGLCVLDLRTQTFAPVALPHRTEKPATDEQILKLQLDRSGQVWVGAPSALFLLDTRDLSCKNAYFEPLPLAGRLVEQFVEMPDGAVAFFGYWTNPARQMLYTLDTTKHSPVPFRELRPGLGALDTVARQHSRLTWGDGAFWMPSLMPGSDASLVRFDWAGKTSEVVSKKQITKDILNTFPVPSFLPGGFVLMQSFFGKSVVFDTKTRQKATLDLWKTSYPDGKMAAVFTDRDGNVWIAPRFDGLFFFPMKNLPATPLDSLNHFHEKRAVEWYAFTGISSGEHWWLGSSNGGFYRYAPASGAFREIINPHTHGMDYPGQFLPQRGDTLWFTPLNGIWWLNVKNGQYGRVRKPGLPTLTDSVVVYTMMRDSRGHIWANLWRNGVLRYDPQTDRFTHYSSKGGSPSFPLPSATAIEEDGDGNIWFGYARSSVLVRWHPSTGRFDSVALQNPTTLNPAATWDIRADRRRKCLWLLTEDAFFKLQLPGLQVELIDKSKGLTTNQLTGFTLDRDGGLWLATSNGLNFYDPERGIVRVFLEPDGLPSSAITDVVLLDTARNILLVSTDRGLCTFEPDKIERNTRAPLMYITAVRVGGKSMPFGEGLSLSHRQNDVSIDFTGINFFDGDRNTYRYRLDGGDDTWVEAGASKSATYLNLAPGKYTFRVQAANGDGLWSTTDATLEITVHPPFWATWTFRFCTLGLLLGGGYWFAQRRIRELHRRETEKANIRQQLADLEVKALRAQMNPHFIFNALNSVQNFMLKNNVREASRYLSKFARLMRLILENSENQYVVLAREVELLRYYTELEALRFNQRFQFDIEIDSKIDPEKTSIPGMLIQPHLENAIWHGLMHKDGPGHVRVRFLQNGPASLRCEIEDDGIGRARARDIEKDRPTRHRSAGVTNIRQRLELLNARLEDDIHLEIIDLHDSEGHPCGTKVVVKMPILVVG